MQTMPDLTGRNAVCTYCRSEVPSNPNLPFFEYLGVGSRDAERCVHPKPLYRGGVWQTHNPETGAEWRCGLREEGHQPGRTGADHSYMAGDFSRETDRYYCGCRGWD
jgi:hypothetical protein